MSSTGLEVFDKTLQITHIWLDEVMAELGPDRQRAYHALRSVLHALRDRLPLNLAAHFGAQLPLLVRGIYDDSWHPQPATTREREQEEFLEHVRGLQGTRPMDVGDATCVVFGVIARQCGGRPDREGQAHLAQGSGALAGRRAGARAAGPAPGRCALLSPGACDAGADRVTYSPRPTWSGSANAERYVIMISRIPDRARAETHGRHDRGAWREQRAGSRRDGHRTTSGARSRRVRLTSARTPRL